MMIPMDQKTLKELASKGGRARMAALSRAQRVALGKRASAIRRGKVPAKPKRQYLLLALTDDPHRPELVFVSPAREQVIQEAKKLGGRPCITDWIDGFTINRAPRGNDQ